MSSRGAWVLAPCSACVMCWFSRLRLLPNLFLTGSQQRPDPLRLCAALVLVSRIFRVQGHLRRLEVAEHPQRVAPQAAVWAQDLLACHPMQGLRQRDAKTERPQARRLWHFGTVRHLRIYVAQGAPAACL